MKPGTVALDIEVAVNSGAAEEALSRIATTLDRMRETNLFYIRVRDVEFIGTLEQYESLQAIPASAGQE